MKYLPILLLLVACAGGPSHLSPLPVPDAGAADYVSCCTKLIAASATHLSKDVCPNVLQKMAENHFAVIPQSCSMCGIGCD